MTLGGWGLATRGTSHVIRMIRGLELSALPYTYFHWRDWRLTNHKDQLCFHKDLKWQVLESFWVVQYIGFLGSSTCSERAWKLWSPSYIPCPIQLFHLAVLELYPLYKLVRVSKAFPCCLANYQTWEDHENLKYITGWLEVQVTTWDGQLAFSAED